MAGLLGSSQELQRRLAASAADNAARDNAERIRLDQIRSEGSLALANAKAEPLGALVGTGLSLGSDYLARTKKPPALQTEYNPQGGSKGALAAGLLEFGNTWVPQSLLWQASEE